MKISKKTFDKKIADAETRGWKAGKKSALDMIDYRIDRERDPDDPSKRGFP